MYEISELEKIFNVTAKTEEDIRILRNAEYFSYLANQSEMMFWLRMSIGKDVSPKDLTKREFCRHTKLTNGVPCKYDVSIELTKKGKEWFDAQQWKPE